MAIRRIPHKRVPKVQDRLDTVESLRQKDGADNSNLIITYVMSACHSGVAMCFGGCFYFYFQKGGL